MKNILTAILASTVALAPIAAAAETCSNEGLKRIQQRGTLIAGVKADYKPWGYRDTNGNIVGLEIDITRLEGKRKLSQNRDDRDFASTVAALEQRGDNALAAAMRRARAMPPASGEPG